MKGRNESRKRMKLLIKETYTRNFLEKTNVMEGDSPIKIYE
jgi:hypothetical protein